MKADTLQLYEKYRYFYYLVSNERFTLFHKDVTEVEYERFFDMLQYILYTHWCIKPYWNYFKKRRSQIIKIFDYKKYEISLRPYFCSDINKYILSFIFEK